MCGFMVEPCGIDFGYRLSESHWQQGYGYEAAKALLDFGLIKHFLKNVIAVAFKANLASIKIIENLDLIAQSPIMFSGFTVEKYILTRNNEDG
jgi:RimJ/RimL family protein N-acetyltransferase